MSHSFVKIWIHGIFSTKDRINLIQPEFEDELYTHIKESLEHELNCNVRIMNGIQNHLHILFLLSQNYSIKDVFQKIKGESSHWINQNNFSKYPFSWQKGYAAFSISESKLSEIENYIKNQKEHHKKKSFQEEYDVFMKKYGFDIINH